MCGSSGAWADYRDERMNNMRSGTQRPQLTPPSGRATRQRQNGAGNAHRNYERYMALAREANSHGDLIEAENCYQHAEHYFRLTRER
jgi:hypothetical protein